MGRFVDRGKDDEVVAQGDARGALAGGGDRTAMLAQLHARYGNAFVLALLDELEREAAALPDQPQAALMKLEDLAAKQRADVDTLAAPPKAPTANTEMHRDEAAAAHAAIASFVGEARREILAANKGTDRRIADAGKRGREQIVPARDDARADAANDERLVDDAVAVARRAADATASMRALLGLPAELQGKAIDKLTDAELDHVLATVPDANREELLALVKNTTNPQRKLKLWGVYHKAHAMHDAQHDGAGKDAEQQRRHAARINAATTTATEVDDEIKVLQDRAKAGTALTEKDVNDLIARKDTEHAMEMRYNLNFTNDNGATGGSPRAVWGDDELKAFDQTLRRMPDAHLAGNAGLKEVRRQQKVFWGDPKNGVEIGGIAQGDGLVRIPDQTAQGGMTAEHRQDADKSLTPKISRLEWVMTHELGHNVSLKYSKEYQAYIKANGWEAYPKTTNKLTDAEKSQLEAKRGNAWDNRATVDKDGKTYQIDQQSDGYISYTTGAIPRSGEAEAGDSGYADPWGYARTRDFESFAEHYDFAMHVPEKVYKDFVEKPHAATERARAKLAASVSPDDKKAAQKDLDIAAATEKARKESFDIMRNQVYGTQAEQVAATKRLEARHIARDKIDAFNLAAARVSTPDQVRVLEADVK